MMSAGGAATADETTAEELPGKTTSDLLPDSAAGVSPDVEAASAREESDSATSSAALRPGAPDAEAPAGVAAFDTRRSEEPTQWIVGHDPEYYTLQIISLSTEESVKRFLESIAVRGRVKGYVGYDVEGATRYGAFIGIYSSYADAARAREQLPPHIQAYEPWIRKVKDVRQSTLFD